MRALTVALPWFTELDAARQGVLVNMAFQMGTAGLLAFNRTLVAIAQQRYAEASAYMLQSKWAKQTPARAKRMADQMETGEWQWA